MSPSTYTTFEVIKHMTSLNQFMKSSVLWKIESMHGGGRKDANRLYQTNRLYQIQNTGSGFAFIAKLQYSM